MNAQVLSYNSRNIVTWEEKSDYPLSVLLKSFKEPEGTFQLTPDRPKQRRGRGTA